MIQIVIDLNRLICYIWIIWILHNELNGVIKYLIQSNNSQYCWKIKHARHDFRQADKQRWYPSGSWWPNGRWSNQSQLLVMLPLCPPRLFKHTMSPFQIIILPSPLLSQRAQPNRPPWLVWTLPPIHMWKHPLFLHRTVHHSYCCRRVLLKVLCMYHCLSIVV